MYTQPRFLGVYEVCTSLQLVEQGGMCVIICT